MSYNREVIRRYLPIPKDLAQLIQWYERYISPLSLIAGFVADNAILLKRVDLWQSNALLFFYLLLAAAGIIFINAVEAGRITGEKILPFSPIAPVVVQFAFGGLFSGFVSLYSRSASLYGTWIFVVVLAALLIGNERFRKLYLRFSFQIALFFSSLFLFLIFFLPIVFHSIGDTMFLFSGLCAITITAAFLFLFALFTPSLERRERAQNLRSIAVIYLSINILYFTNLIPPLPLALKDAGVYHHVEKLSDGNYALEGEYRTWYESFFPVPMTFHKVPGEKVYLYTAVFAPSGLSTPIIYEWQRFVDGWVTMSTFSFSITGGRDGGYRAYSFISDPEAGQWRVNVLTPAGLLIGRVAFIVIGSTSTPALGTFTR